jgi:uncharacterized membrane protein YbhN (UPF0104 family)
MSDRTEQKTRGPVVWNIIKALLALCLLGFVVSKVELSRLLYLHRQVSVLWLFIDLILFIILTLVKARQYQALINYEVSYHRVLNIVVLQNAITNFVASSAGIASYLALLHIDEGVKVRKVAASFLVAKVSDLWAVAILLSVSAVWVGSQVTALRELVAVLLLAVASGMGIFLAAIFTRGQLVRFLERFACHMHVDRLTFVQKVFASLRLIVDQDVKTIFGILQVGLLYSLIYMAVTVMWGYSNMRVFSLVLAPESVAFVTALLQLVSWIPVQMFGGLGVNEALLVYLYAQFGVPQTEMALVSIGIRLLFYLLILATLAYLPLSALFIKEKVTK